MYPARVIILLWVAWGISWLAAASWTNKTEKRAGLGAEAGGRLLMVLGAFVLAVPAHGYEGPLRLWHVGLGGAWSCILLMASGFAFAWWARIQLGRLWSGEITRKAEHRVVDAGPYAIVRHPIYTGQLLAVAATAVAKGTILGLVGAALVVTGTWLKARLEERWLSQELGPDAYQSYRRRVPMLIPFGPRASRKAA